MINEVQNKPSQTIKICILQSGHTEIFSKGLTHDFGQKLEISSMYEIIFDNHLVRKQAFQDYKNIDFTYLAYRPDFFGGVNP